MPGNNTEPEIVQPKPRKSVQEVEPIATFYSGPIPDPEDFAAYEKAVPGAGKTILNAFTSQTKHRHKMEKKAVNSQVFLQAFGMTLGWLITLAIIAVAAWLLYKGKNIQGLGVIAIALIERWYASTRKDDPKK